MIKLAPSVEAAQVVLVLLAQGVPVDPEELTDLPGTYRIVI